MQLQSTVRIPELENFRMNANDLATSFALSPISNVFHSGIFTSHASRNPKNGQDFLHWRNGQTQMSPRVGVPGHS